MGKCNNETCFCDGSCYKEEKRSGFIDDVDGLKKSCTDIDHNPPMFIHIPCGKIYRHICPSCKKETLIKRPNIKYKNYDSKTHNLEKKI